MQKTVINVGAHAALSDGNRNNYNSIIELDLVRRLNFFRCFLLSGMFMSDHR